MTNLPPFLLPAALALWGWQSGFLWIGLLLGIAFESARHLRYRWVFSRADLDRVWNLCAALFFGLTVFLMASDEHGAGVGQWWGGGRNRAQAAAQGAQAFLRLLAWLPLVFAPMMLVQAWGETPRIPVSTFSWFLRRQRREREIAGRKERSVDMTWGYLALVVFSSAVGNRPEGYFAALAILTGWTLWTWRNKRFHVATWATTLVFALGLGWLIQLGLRPLSSWWQSMESRWIASALGGRFDAHENRTWLGQVGSLKASGRIIHRVRVPKGQNPPALLREASYEGYKGTTWHNQNRDEFSGIVSETNETSWVIQPDQKGIHSMRIWARIPRERTLLPLPPGAARLDNLPAFLVETNRMGTLRISGPGLVSYDVSFTPGFGFDGPPTGQDLNVPESERLVIERMSAELGIRPSDSPDVNLRKVEMLFLNYFGYSLWQSAPAKGSGTNTPLGRFLVETRKGHCEYFATATALLLRAAGIPTRYAVGWAVQEGSGGQFILRARHAHSWALAWVDGKWRDVDNTPGVWVDVEESKRSWFEPVNDAISRLVFEINRLRFGQANLRAWLLAPAGLILLLALVQLLRGRQWRRAQKGKKERMAPSELPGLDSEFYEVERHLAREGLGRRSGETLAEWAQRVEDHAGRFPVPVRDLLRWHYQLRFDPLGLRVEERNLLRTGVEAWVSARKQSRSRAAPKAPSGLP